MALERQSTVLGRQLGETLRQYRLTAAMSTTQAADALDCTKGKISRMENGRVLVRTPDVVALLRAYGIADEDVHQRLSALARAAHPRHQRGWWDEYAQALSHTYRDYIALEALAEHVCNFQPQVLPGLLQSPDYARALAVARQDGRTDGEIEQFIHVRAARQRRLAEEPLLTLSVVVTEGAVRQQIGGPKVWRAQMEHVLEVAQRPNITVRVLPFSASAYMCVNGPFLLLSFPKVSERDVALCESPIGDMWREHDDDVALFRAGFDNATDVALEPDESFSLLRRITKEYQ
ncbi:helix-turn-helix domain-containing protein [Streptomyces sp. NPDC048172]|uniref:helix-turn-helix domain-containing protein n=1 Tax=Streptomyces sp. NPDC048172 TaxID=3365505 RepID=UPI00372483E4